MKKVIRFPARYVQGKGVAKETGFHIKPWGENPFLIGGPTSLSVITPLVEESLEKTGLQLAGTYAVTECTENVIEITGEKARNADADLIIGSGGGVVADTAKAVASNLDVPIVNVPTVASTNADASAESVIYDENGRYLKSITFPENPKIVIVDTEILASAPPRFLVSGMGDALACRFEAEACVRSRSKNGGATSNSILNICRLCFETLLREGEPALQDVTHKKVTPAVENIIEAIKLESSIGFENGGLAAAHAIHNGFTQSAHPDATHGEIVAFCVLAQLNLEDKPRWLIDTIGRWCRRVGLPTTLDELSVSEEDIDTIAESACASTDTMSHEPFPVTPRDVTQSILAAHQLGLSIIEEEQSF